MVLEKVLKEALESKLYKYYKENAYNAYNTYANGEIIVFKMNWRRLAGILNK